jgi:hypothetical protein
MAVNPEQLEYCLTHMLPVWERWTNGNLAARRLVERDDVDPLSRGCLFRKLHAAARTLDPAKDPSSAKAAQAAATACCQACIGMPAERFERTCRQARVADARASRAHVGEVITDGTARGIEHVNHGSHASPLPDSVRQIRMLPSLLPQKRGQR